MRWPFLIAFAVAVGVPGPGLVAQSVAGRTPNLQGTWTAAKGVVQFNFLHRFSLSDAPLRKVQNTPTFHVGTGLTESVMVGFTYGSNSALVPSYPNEWEFFARARPLTQASGSPFDLSLQGGYNVASESVDGELVAARAFGRLRVLAVGRAFSSAYDGDDSRFAIAGGASLSLTPRISLGGDWGTLIDRAADEPRPWSAGVQMGIPFTPHSFSVHASNVGTSSLEGASRGQRTRWGFEYTIPITLKRYTAGTATTTPSATATAPAAGPILSPAFQNAQPSGDTVFVDIVALAYSQPELQIAPGTTVVWRNLDPLPHSILSDDGDFDSGLFDPQVVYALTFPSAGTFPYHCLPHPFMKGVVMVRADPDTAETR